MPTLVMTPLGVLALVVASVDIAIVARGQIWTVRQRCGSVLADRVVFAGSVLAFGCLAFATFTHSIPAIVVGTVILWATTLFPDAVIRVTGGPDPICFLRREIWTILGLLQERPIPDDALQEAEARREALERYDSELTAPVIDAIDAIFDARLPTEPDRAATLRAYDRFDEAIAALKAAHPW